MAESVHGLHHITAIAGDPVENLEFYTRVLGLRLVKKSVNQDAPDTYHLFYADEAGSPGTDLTFFPWPAMGPARPGIGLAVEVPFAIPRGSLAYWQSRLAEANVKTGDLTERFGETVLPFDDPHGLKLALVEIDPGRPFAPWAHSPVPPEHQLIGMHAARLWVGSLGPTEAFLTQVLGFEQLGAENGWRRFGVDGGGSGNLVEVKALPGERRGAWGTGGVHHVAWRVRDDAEQMQVRAAVAAAGLGPTHQIDRFWFKSVYFREPGGVLFELATDGPGFAVDEDSARLGEKLVLPPWLEPQRGEIEAALPALTT
jgi:glyoxalase family protein